jgi:N-acetylglucosaminyldiphosphoundecaprenol N-acetyl-beta-D-mannosaminyltransferase
MDTRTDAALPEAYILGVKVTCITEEELNRAIARIIRRGDKELVLNVNIHAINQALRHPFMKDLLNSAEIVFCDGYGVVLGGKILGIDIPERITYADWLWNLAAVCEREGFSFYFLGAKEGVAALAARKLQEKYPSLKIAGIQNGYFTKTGPENEAVIDRINRSRADILVLGLGMPMQERWLADNWEKIGARVALTGGGCFDFISGTVRRAPRWMADNGLEWLFRYLLEPRRMFARYIIGNPLFIARVIAERLLSGRAENRIHGKKG